MPTLHLRAVPAELLARLRAGARARDLPIDTYALDVLQSGLDVADQRSAAGKARVASQTPHQRSESARQAVQARWAKRAARK